MEEYKDKIKILALEKPLRCEDCKIDYDVEKYKRKSLKDQDEKIEESWREKLKNNSRLYNASKFRLAGIEFGGEKEEEKLTPKLLVGITDYKDLQGTHYSEHRHRWEKESLATFGGASAAMSNCIGVGAICVSADRKVILIKRAGWTAEHSGKIDRPGGHPEPSNAIKAEKMEHEKMFEHLVALRKQNTDEPYFEQPKAMKMEDENGEQLRAMKIEDENYDQLDPDFVLREIFESPAAELRDEIGIPLDKQSPPLLLGRIEAKEYANRVGLDFLIETSMTSEEISVQYDKGHQTEADESLALIILDLRDVRMWNQEVKKLNMTPHCIGGLLLLRDYSESLLLS